MKNLSKLNGKRYHKSVVPKRRRSRMLIAALTALMIPTSLLTAASIMSNAAEGDYLNVQNYIAQNVNKGLTGDIEKTDEFVENNPMSRMVALMSTGEDLESIANSNDQLVATDHQIIVKYTYIDASTIDDDTYGVFDLDEAANGNEDNLLNYIVSQSYGYATLYDTTGDYYVAFVAPSLMNHADKIINSYIAKNNDHGEMIEKAEYDENSGLVYVPKDYIDIDNGAQIQLLVSHQFVETTRSVDVYVDNKINADHVIDTKAVDSDPADISVAVPLIDEQYADQYSILDFDVYVNDSQQPLKASEYAYDHETGMLSVSGSSMSMLSIRIEVVDDMTNAEALEKAVAYFNEKDVPFEFADDDENGVSDDEATESDDSGNTAKSAGDYSVSTFAHGWEEAPNTAGEGDDKSWTNGWNALPNVTLKDPKWGSVSLGFNVSYSEQAKHLSLSNDWGNQTLNEIRDAAKKMFPYTYVPGNNRGEGGGVNIIGTGADTEFYAVIRENKPLNNYSHDTACAQRIDPANSPRYCSFVVSLPQNSGDTMYNDTSQSWVCELGNSLQQGNPEIFKHSNGAWMVPVVPTMCSHVQQPIGTFVQNNFTAATCPMKLVVMVKRSDYIVFGLVTGGVPGSVAGDARYKQSGAAMFKVNIAPQQTGGLKLQKESTSGKTNCFDGARYNVYDEDGNYVGTIETGPDGSGQIDGLPADKYYWVHETTAPDGFEIDYSHGLAAPPWYDSKKDVFSWWKEGDTGWYHPYCPPNDYGIIGLNGALTVREDESDTPYLQKYDKSSNSVIRMSGFVFDIYDADTDEVVMDNVATDSDGKIDLSELEPGNYYAMEVSVPDGSGYTADTTTKESFEITEDSNGVVVKFYNEKEEEKHQYLQVVKYDATTGQIARQEGFEFEVEGPSGSLGTFTTDSTGIAYVGEVDPGTYTATEVAVPSSGNWILNSTPESETVPEGGGGTISIKIYNDRQQFGGICVVKGSMVPDMTSDNANYLLAGAEFGIYSDSACTNLVEKLVTGEDGTAYTDIDRFEEGETYYVKEIKSPQGFTVDHTPYMVTIVGGTYVIPNGNGIINIPRYGEPPALQKIDSEKEKNEPQGNASLAGAEFTWTYTDGASKTVTWITVTDEDGYTTLDSAHLKPGSPNLWTYNGKTVLPIGKLTAQETKTPEGYNINGEKFEWEIKDNGSLDDPLIPLTGDELCPDVPEDVIKGGLSLKKLDDELDEYTSQGDGDITEVRFQLFNRSTHSVIVNGKEFAKDAEITEYSPITLGADGIFTIPNNTLPYGDYELIESTTPTGYHGAASITVQIRESKVYGPEDVTFRNKIIRGKVEMPKVDTELSTYDGEETKTGNPQGDATVVGAEFTIKNVSKNPVLVDGPDGKRLYAVGEDCLVITTGSDGWARSAEDALPYGTYELRETKAPEGYNGTDEVWRFTIRTEDQLASPANVEERIDNIPIRGGVRMPKVDAALVRQPGYETVEGQATGDATLDGAEFEIYNISKSHVRVGGVLYEPGERIMTIPDANRTDKYYDTIITVGGIAKTTDDALPYGTYEMKESKAPEGYEKSSETYTFSIETEGQMCGPGVDDVEDKFDDVPSSWQPGGDKRDKELSQLSEDDAEQPAGADDVDDANANENASEEDTSDDATASAEATDESETVTTDGVTITDPSVSINDIGLDKNPQTNAQGDATLEGAEFYLMNRSKNMVVVGGEVYQPDERILTIPQPDGGYDDVVTSDATGTIAFGEEGLPYGTYELGEETAPRGYNLSDDTYIIELHGKSSGKAISSEEAIASGKATNDEVIGSSKADDAIDDTAIHGGLSVQKVDKETGRGDTIVTNEGENVDDIDYAANVPADAVDGESSDDTASDDESSENEDTDVSDVDVKTAAKSDDDTGNDGSGDNSGDSVVLGDDVSDGSGSASDTDVDLNAFHRATLAGTMFEIRNASDKAVIVDGKLYQVDQVVKTITTNAQGYAATEPTALPFGTYDVYEVGAPNGYISSADSYGNADGVDDVREKTYVQTVEIREQGVIVPCARPFANQIKRGDITFQKIDDDGNVMPHVAFRVTSKTTGESHIIVTDENGVYNSSSSVIPHSQNTNANDDAFDADGNVDDDALVHDAGTWFYGKADGKPFYTDDQYTLPNYNDRFGASYVDDSADTDADNNAVDGDVDGTTDGADNVSDTTTDTDDATNENDGALVLGDDVEGGSGSMGSGSGTPAIVNPVYTVTDDEGASTDVTIGYVATDENGSFENNSVVFNADGSITIVYDKTIVDMNTGERRSSTSYETYAEGNWSVKVAATNGLIESEDGYVDADGDGEYDIVDNEYAYTDKWQFPMSVVDDNLGAFPYDEYVFEELPSEATYGHNLVVFEATIERHNYLLNLGPITDNIIDIYTTATDQSDGDHILTTDEKVTIVDTVEYTNLNTDREYTMTGTLMDYETGEPMLDGNGNPITSSVTFKPESPNGSIDVVFELDATQLGGVQTVVFEDLYWNNIHIASHADIEDKNQLVEFHPEIGTVAVGDQTNDHFVYDDGSVIIVDTVHYKGVVPGREFIVHGILMDKNTGDALIDANGNTVENSVIFTPETSEGDVEVLFEFDATNLAGLDVVVFENLYHIDTVTNRQPDDNGDENQAPVGDVPTKQRLVATHADINDESQTVNVRASGLASDQIMTPLVQTGAMVGAGLLGVAAIGGAVTYVVKRKRNGR